MLKKINAGIAHPGSTAEESIINGLPFVLWIETSMCSRCCGAGIAVPLPRHPALMLSSYELAQQLDPAARAMDTVSIFTLRQHMVHEAAHGYRGRSSVLRWDREGVFTLLACPAMSRTHGRLRTRCGSVSQDRSRSLNIATGSDDPELHAATQEHQRFVLVTCGTCPHMIYGPTQFIVSLATDNTSL
ncbi:hypothetical protein DOTSEDRAFT_72178 [Dothistroma septosporum NZE10]|uniref:Uncharacterized protein n=1 Tax=Dothistroma septosporum (strain NZE10 / CBS 128990) TaxID=675120 RepID=N1PQK1_DOTSN|nr:hypothetical protein DOTSEDRAFT_72178 [Dothistroma septosporum NZE10]